MEDFDIRKELLNRLKAVNPLDLLDMLLYVSGVVLLVYAVMQLIHGIEAKDRSVIKRGIVFLFISLLLVVQRIIIKRLGLL